MSIKLANNAIGVVVSSIGSGATTIHLGAGQGQRFPSLNAGEWFPATITSDAGAMEIVSVTARSGDVLTVERGQEGTQPIEFPAGSIIELRLTAGSHSHSVTVSNRGGGQAHNNVQPTLVTNMIIKT